jgi:hypothetical protein
MSANVVAGEWRTEKPDAPGDWLWVAMWGCGGGCNCVRKAGVAWVTDYADRRVEDDEPPAPEEWMDYATADGRRMWLAWGDPPPSIHDGVADVTHWAPLALPDCRAAGEKV